MHLAGPFGIGALVLKQAPGGLSLNGAPPSDAVLLQLQEQLGFDLPLDNLHFWLLGVPDPATTFELTRNDQDRAKQLSQAGWSIVYDRYMPVEGDLLPARLILSRDECAGANRHRSLGLAALNAATPKVVARAGEAQFIPAYPGQAAGRLPRTANLFSVRRSMR